FHDLPYAFDGKIHWGECFHGVSCSRRRGDGARRSLGNHQPVSRNNRHHQRRCTVPGKPTNTVFVQHHGSPPVQPHAGIHHGTGQGARFIQIKRQRGARG